MNSTGITGCDDSMLVYTSVTKSYIPKARVLAQSLKRFHSDWTFCLLLSDEPPANFDLAQEPFDILCLSETLDIPNWKAWAFGHSIVELCTAVKGPAADFLARVYAPEKIMYLDPDIRVYAPLDDLDKLLEEYDVLLTPHLLVHETAPEAISDNEICALRHGVFNLGFFAARTDGQGSEFISWWRDRLLAHCIDDIPGGLFNDQRWCDLAPCFFSRLHIVRDRGYNTATWNVARRPISRTTEGKYYAGPDPLRFYHFTGYDSGDGMGMLGKYAPNQPDAFELWEAYGRELEAAGNGDPALAGWAYGQFSNGEAIPLSMRRLYRSRPDLQETFPDPYLVVDGLQCYTTWWKEREETGRLPGEMAATQPAMGRMKKRIRLGLGRIGARLGVS